MNVLRTIHPMDFYYTKSSQSYRVTEVQRCRLDVRRVREMIQLQLMCCALSNLSSSQFMRGWTSYGIEGRKGLRELEGVRSNLIFKLVKYKVSYYLYT
jgi:hypothetical protein